MPLLETVQLLGVESLTTTNFADTRSYGDSVRMRKATTPGWGAPSQICLVYIKFEPNNKVTVRHIYSDNLNGGLDVKQQELFTAAEGGGGTGTNFNTIAFPAPCYLSVFIDNEEWDFYYPQPTVENPIGSDDHDPIMFIDRKTLIVEIPGQNPVLSDINYLTNHTFYDCEPVTARNAANRVRNGIRCRNYFRDQYGNILGDVTETFGFQIYIRAPYAITDTIGRKLVLIIDPDGQNQGPPH